MAYAKKFNVGVIGCGFLGSSIVAGFSNYANIKVYDKFKDFDSFESTVNHADILFFCLPTPFFIDDNGKQDLTILEDSVKTINDFIPDGVSKVAVIKSTVLPGTNRKFQEKYTKLKFVSNPEFLSAASARSDFICASRNILGGPEDAVNVVDELYKHRFGNSLQTFKTNWESAELTKYACNNFFSVKLSFFNYIYTICQNLGLNYDEVRDMIVSDGRIGRSHDKVPGENGIRGWGNYCFPKDIQAFINFSKEIGIDPKLLSATWEQNLEDRPNKDWEKLGPSVVSYKNNKK